MANVLLVMETWLQVPPFDALGATQNAQNICRITKGQEFEGHIVLIFQHAYSYVVLRDALTMNPFKTLDTSPGSFRERTSQRLSSQWHIAVWLLLQWGHEYNIIGLVDNTSPSPNVSLMLSTLKWAKPNVN